MGFVPTPTTQFKRDFPCVAALYGKNFDAYVFSIKNRLVFHTYAKYWAVVLVHRMKRVTIPTNKFQFWVF